MGNNQTLKLLHSEGNHWQNEKTIYLEGKTLANDMIDKGLIITIYKWFIQLNI